MAGRFLFAWRNAFASEEGPSCGVDRHVAMTLSLYMNGDGLGAWPSQDTLALRTGLTDRTVGRALERLCGEGWLARQPRKSSRGIRHKRYGYEYRATLPKALSNALANGERGSLFNGKEPWKPRPKKNGESDDKRMANGVRTNSSEELIKGDASKKDDSLTQQEIADVDALRGSS
jgi:DNA-binding transcriptional MocR family regulator